MTVKENATMLFVNATDADTGINGEIIHRIVDGNYRVSIVVSLTTHILLSLCAYFKQHTLQHKFARHFVLSTANLFSICIAVDDSLTIV